MIHLFLPFHPQNPRRAVTMMSVSSCFDGEVSMLTPARRRLRFRMQEKRWCHLGTFCHLRHRRQLRERAALAAAFAAPPSPPALPLFPPSS